MALNDLRWQNTDTRLVTYGIGLAVEDIDDDTSRDARIDRDVLERNLKPEDYDKAQRLFGTYYHMFVGGVTEQHRAFNRAKAREFWNWADEFDNRFWNEANRLDAKSMRDMRRQMCVIEAQMNSVGGTTRSCMMAKLKGDLAKDTLVDLNAAKLESFQRMQEAQGNMYNAALGGVYRAYIEADAQDYNKLVNTLQLMKGSWTRNDMAERTREEIERDILTKRATADWERQAGSTSETAGDYAGDYASVLANQGPLQTIIDGMFNP